MPVYRGGAKSQEPFIGATATFTCPGCGVTLPLACADDHACKD